MTQSDSCVSVIIKDAEVLQAGTTIYYAYKNRMMNIRNALSVSTVYHQIIEKK